jgi:signal transduction histidine kinase
MSERAAVLSSSELRKALHAAAMTAGNGALSGGFSLPVPAIALLTAVCYYLGSQIGFVLTPAGTPISVFWPPNAILLAILLLTPRRIWWVLLLAVLPAHLLIQLKAGIPVISALGWFVGNTGEALLGAACIRHFQKEKELLFTSVHGIVTFLVFGVLLAPLVTSFLDAGSTTLTGLGRGYWTLWMNRLSSNMIANLTLVPTIVTLGVSAIPWFQRARRAQYLEASLLAAGTAVVSFLVFAKGSIFDHGPAFICGPLPLLAWAAMRFGPAGLNFTMLEVTLISVWSALEGKGIFEHASMPDRAVSVQILLGLFVLPLMLVAAVVVELRRNQQALETARGKLIHFQEQEYHHIARELHTDIAGRLTLAGLSVDELRASNASVTPPLNRLYDQISGALKAILLLSHKIHPFSAEYLGLARAITKLCHDTGAENGVTIRSSTEDVPSDVPLEVSIRIFRVAQLALQNILERHAETASVELKLGSEQILLRIADDGVGTDPQNGETLGLAFMREQTLSLGGTLQTTSATPRGMVMEASFPTFKASPNLQNH